MKEEETFQLKSETLGALPLINHYLERLQLPKTFKRYLTYNRSPHWIPPDLALGVLLRNVILGKEPVYGVKAWASQFAPPLFQLQADQMDLLNDDKIGRALDMLFDADRASLMTEIVVRAIQEFQLDLNQLHNDSTSLTFFGEYDQATGGPQRGKKTLKITRGYNRDHRPDLKQLLWILTVTADGAVPIHYRVCDGNTTDDCTHLETWQTLRRLVGHAEFIYVADSKLCVSDTLQYIAGEGGRFITVLPRTRSEDQWFREYLVTHHVNWEEVRRISRPRRKPTSPEVWRVVESPLRSAEGYRIVWVWSSQKAEHDQKRRQALIKKAILELEALNTRLASNHCRLRTPQAVVKAADEILKETTTEKWVRYEIQETVETNYRQTTRGRPGPHTQYRAIRRRHFQIEWQQVPENIKASASSDGMFPLLTNCEDLSLERALEIYKYQPTLEKRHEQLKSVNQVTPIFLNSITRIEGMLFLHFLALLVQSLIEREVRLGMKKTGLTTLPIYHEGRPCRAPTATRVLEVFDHLQRHYLLKEEEGVQTFNPDYTKLQLQLLELLAVPRNLYPGLNK